jgi:hypothetical protein
MKEKNKESADNYSRKDALLCDKGEYLPKGIEI